MESWPTSLKIPVEESFFFGKAAKFRSKTFLTIPSQLFFRDFTQRLNDISIHFYTFFYRLLFLSFNNRAEAYIEFL